MYTRRNRCLPTFHSTSTISRPSERATRSAAPRIFSKSTQRLPDHSRSAVHSNRRQQKSGLAPTHGATRCTAKARYGPRPRFSPSPCTGGSLDPFFLNSCLPLEQLGVRGQKNHLRDSNQVHIFVPIPEASSFLQLSLSNLECLIYTQPF